LVAKRSMTPVPAHNFTPSLEFNLTSPEGVPGWLVTFHKHTADKGSPFAPAHELAATEVARFNLRDTRMKLNDFVPAGLGAEWTAYLRATMVLDDTGAFELGLAVAGRARVYVDGECVLENWDRQTRGEFIYGYVPFFLRIFGFLRSFLCRSDKVLWRKRQL
jgi:beta-glucosidase